ncbi:MAG: type I restriction enzyme HsdR N-terminal domain-containing protein [Bacteroidales bacterium]|nr:type I restriction enzyme HsdR N-terminal domain-containing protein [Bacteroidales bacterium]
MMHKLNLPDYQFNIRDSKESLELYDVFRQQFVKITPEEWVRQNFLAYLVHELEYPAGLIAVEKGINVGGMQRRFDAVVYDKEAQPIVLIEFKAPSVKISQATFDQAANYNKSLRVSYLVVSNGLNHYCAFIDFGTNEIHFLQAIPNYKNLLRNDG